MQREREGAGTAEPREECLDIIKDGPHDCTGRRGVGGVAAAGCCLVLMAKRNCQDERRAKLAIDKKTLPEKGDGARWRRRQGGGRGLLCKNFRHFESCSHSLL